MGEPDGRGGRCTGVSLVVAIVMAAAVVPWLGVGVVGAASCTTVTGGTTITNPGCYVLEGSQSDGDEEDSDVSRYVEVQSSDVVIDGNGNTIDGTGSGEAVYVDGAHSNVTVRNVTLTDWATGIYVRDADDVAVEDVTVKSGGIGVSIDTTTNATVERVSTSANADYGVYLKSSPGAVVGSVTADADGKNGVRVEGSDGATVRDATITGAGEHGLYLRNSPNGSVVNVTVENASTDGINVDSSANATVRDSTVRTPAQHGLFVTGSLNASVVRVTSEDAALNGIHVDASDDAVVRDSTVRRAGQHGVYVTDANGNASVRNNTVANSTTHGFRVHHSDGSTLAGNTARDSGSAGIRISSELAAVRDSLFERNAVGVYLYKHSHVVENNTVRANGYGITLDGDNTTIAHNRITGSTTAGFHYVSGKNDLVYDNLFNNSRNVDFSTTADSSNRWNVSARAGTNVLGGSAVGGNAWFDPAGNGHSELWDDADADGFSDSNYTVNGTNVDDLPLNAADALSITPANHDYGNVSLTTNVTKQFVVESHARPDVTVDRTGIEGLNALMFVLESDPTPVTLSTGETVAANVTFDPTLTGLLTANLSVESDTAGVSGVNATLSGTGIDDTTPTAEAGPNQTVDDGTVVSFDGTNSTDDVGIVSYEWDFGDGNTSTGATPTHTYTAPGTYTVTLNVSDDAGNVGTDTLTVVVSDVTAPTAEAGPNQTVDDGTAVSFDGTDSTDDVGVVSYEWDFGDGNSSTGATTNHTYAAPGDYTATVTVTDDAGNVGTDTVTITVSDATAPVADAGSNRTVDEDVSVGFDGTNSTDDQGIVSYEWDFGDGNTASGATPSHTYAIPGNYTVTLEVTDDAGNVGTDTLTVVVSDVTAPVADAGSNRTVDDGTAVSFDGTGSTDNVGVVSYQWAFGDGNGSTGATPTHTYAAPGTYTVTLNVSDDAGNTDTDTLTVDVTDVTAPVADAGANQTVDDGTAVSFDGTDSTDDQGIASYQWDFGDGNTSTGATTNHTYTAPGNYTATVTVTDDAGNVGTDTVTVTVSDVTAPTAEAGPNQTVDDGTTVALDGTGSTDDVGIVSYEWDLGDGNSSTGATTNHTYTAPGNYTATVTVTDDAGNSQTDTLTVTVSDVTAPVADAGPNQTVDEDTSVTLDGTNSTDDVGVVSYGWDFGDGNSSTGAATNHTYATPGTYTVTLEVTDDAGNVGTDTLTVVVSDVTAPTVDAGSNQTVDEDVPVDFDGTNSTDNVGIVSYEWDFGDGNTSAGATTNHTYAAPGTYSVTLNATDAAGNVGMDTVTIAVSDTTTPTADAGPNQTVDDGTAVSFDGTNSTDNVGVVSYEWDFGDGNTSTGATPNHTYGSVGTYNVTLNVSDAVGNLGTDTLAVTVSDVTAPATDAGSNRTVEEGASVGFDGTNSTDNVGIVSYEWDFGDGKTSTGATANHAYATSGTYTVTLNATDDAGNVGTDTLTVTVDPATTSDGGSGGGGGGGSIGAEPDGEITITERTLLNETATVDDTVVVRVGLVNYDPVRGTITLDLAANGVVVAEREVAVAIDGRRTVYLRTTVDQPGQYTVGVNGVSVGTVEVADDPDEGSADDGVPISPPPEDLSVDIETESVSSADVAVRGVESNRTVPVEFGDDGPSADGVSLSSISFTPTEDDPITMSVTASRDPLPGSPEFDRADNTSGLAHLRVEHSIANDDVDGVRLRFVVPASRLARLETSPDDVALYRYEDGSWTELPTRVLSETDGGYLFVARSPGLSEFATGAKQPQFELRTADVAVDRIRVGDDVRVRVRITNTGGADGTYTAKLLLDERVVSQRRLTIASSGTRQVLFSHEIDQAGSYRVLVNGFPAGNVEVSNDVGENGTVASDASGTGSGGLPLAAGAGVLLTLVVILIVGVGVYRQRAD